MRNIGHKLLLSSLAMIVGMSTACAGILVGFQHSNDSIIGMRGSIGLDDWERTTSFQDDVFLPSVTDIEELANSGAVLDADGFPLDKLSTGTVNKNAPGKVVIWDRFDSNGARIPNGLTD